MQSQTITRRCAVCWKLANTPDRLIVSGKPYCLTCAKMRGTLPDAAIAQLRDQLQLEASKTTKTTTCDDETAAILGAIAYFEEYQLRFSWAAVLEQARVSPRRAADFQPSGKDHNHPVVAAYQAAKKRSFKARSQTYCSEKRRQLILEAIAELAAARKPFTRTDVYRAAKLSTGINYISIVPELSDAYERAIADLISGKP